MPLLRENTWFSRLTTRLGTHWRLKFGGTMGITLLFFVGYFLLLKFPVFPVTIMPMTAFDQWIGFHPWALTLYVSLWLYVQLAPALIVDRRELVSFGWAASALSLFSFVVFLFWPTTISTVKLNAGLISGSAMAQLKTVDASGNACPSLHVTFAVFSAFWNWRLLREIGAPVWIQAVNLCWCVGIVYSTLATKQHVLVDVVAGGALGALGAVWHMQILRKMVLSSLR